MNTQDNTPHPQHDWLPEPTLRRLPWYLAYVTMLRHDGVEHVSSRGIAEAIGVDASQIAKDLSHLGVRGKTRIGYEVAALERELRGFLGFNTGHNAVITGVGSLGNALIQDRGLQRYGLNIVAGFDVNPLITGTIVEGRPVYPLESLATQLPRLKTEIAIIAVPVEEAARVARLCVDAGAKALWNFTPFHITAIPGVAIQNTSIYAHLALIYNRLKDSNPS